MSDSADGDDDALVKRAAGGDVDAWRELCRRWWPEWLRLAAASRTLRGLGEGDDHAHAVAARVAEKLRPDRGAALATFPSWQAANSDKSFVDWMRIVASNVARDYRRELLGRGRKEEEGLPSPMRLLNELASAMPLDKLGVRPPFTAANTAREVLELARRRLPAQQLDALAQWLDGASFAEIGTTLALPDEGAARRLVRAGIATLRRELAVS